MERYGFLQKWQIPRCIGISGRESVEKSWDFGVPQLVEQKTLPTQPIFGVQWNIGGLNDVLLEQKCNLLFTLI